jgi:probable HAF family extracellular repeat protein
LGCEVLQIAVARKITVKDPVCRLIPGADPVDCADDVHKLLHRKKGGNHRAFGSVLATLLAISVPRLFGDVVYSITDLGTLGGNSSQAYGINNHADVVGDSLGHAFLYSGGTMTNLGTLGQGVASAINDKGQIVGYYSTNTQANYDRGFLYNGGIVRDLGTLGGTYCVARGINNSGQIVGNSWTTNGSSHAFLYSGGVMADLGISGGAFGINNSGQVVGWLNAGHAFLYSGGLMADLGTLGGRSSIAYGITSAGQVFGTADTTNGTPAFHPQHAFLYSGGVMKDLDPLGPWNSGANAINDNGQAVGYFLVGKNSPTTACLFNGGLKQDLNTLIPGGSGWTLSNAEAINNYGQIVGYGTIGGNTHAFLLTPFRQLFFNRSATNLVLSWFTNSPALLSLYQNSALTQSNWVAVTNTPTVTNGQNQVVIRGPLVGNRFYRLQFIPLSLKIGRASATSVIVSWPSPSAGYYLQQNTNLASTNWTFVPLTPHDDGTTKSVTLPSGTGSQFFRLAPSSSQNPVQLVQHASNFGHDVGSVATTFPSPNAAGNLLVVAAAASSTLTVSDSLGNSYNAAINNFVGGGNSGHLYIWYAGNSKAGANTVTVSSSGDVDMQVYEVSGADTLAPLDQIATSSGVGSAPSVSSPATTSANEWVLAFLFDWSNSVNFTAGSGYSLEENTHNVAGFQSTGGEDKTIAVAGAQTASMTGVGSSDAWMFGLATFKANGAASATPATNKAH